jgi:peptidoglycan/xylan/chitin deacetylase (PgdA/CDA1 family)
MKILAKNALCALYKYSGLMRAQETLTRLTGRPFLVILLFHRVTDDIPEDGLTVGTARFRRICRMLRDRFHTVPLGQIIEHVRRGTPFPPRTVAITFDDCYRDNLFAAQVLAEHGLPATFFVPAGFVGTDAVFEWDRPLQPLPNLSWDDVRAMVQMGFEIGSHTVTHANLGTLPLPDVRRELLDSRKMIEDKIGQPVRWFAYPFGGRQNFRAECLPLVREAGYEGCVSGFGGLVYPHLKPEILPRENVPSFPSVLNLELHITGCLNWLYALKRRAGLI